MPFDHLLRSRQTPLTMALLIVMAIVVSACGTGAPSAAIAVPKTPVSIQLAWTHEYSSASFYAAEKNGHFAAQNLDVRLEAGGFGPQGYIVPIAQVISGTVDFGVTGAPDLILARAEGKPVVAVATILQRSPLAIFSLTKSGIHRPQDLVGHSVAVADGSATQLYNTLLKSQHIDPATVKTVPRTSYGIDLLAKGEVDAMVAWVINEGVQLNEAGLKTNVMLMSDYGVDSYEMVLFTTEKMIAEHPDTVKRFVKASIQGMQDVINNPDQAANMVLTYDSKLNLDGQRRRMQATLPLLSPPGVRLGVMQPDIWKLTHQMLLDQKVLTQPIDLDRVYTMKFLDEVSGN
ncbi:MAG: ABC transporter substrate-binding protein [Roseiflexaceae bacterium]